MLYELHGQCGKAQATRNLFMGWVYCKGAVIVALKITCVIFSSGNVHLAAKVNKESALFNHFTVCEHSEVCLLVTYICELCNVCDGYIYMAHSQPTHHSEPVLQ